MPTLSFDELAELDRTDQLEDVPIHVERVPGTQLVHLAVGDRAGLVMTRQQARDVAHQLREAAGGRAARARPRP